MGEWKEYRLSDFTEIIKDTYNPDGNNNHAYIGLEHIEQETLRLNSAGVSSDVKSNKFKFKSSDVLFGKLRPYFRKVVKPQFDGICSTDIWVFRAKKGFDQDFLFYFLANWDFVNTANNAESGTRMPRADWSFLKDTEWNLPPLPEQKAIAAVLSSLDDKIDLLHRQNKTLEALAETLFRQWFVEEAEEGWETVPLKSACDIINGFAFKSGDYRDNGRMIIRTMNFNNGFIDPSVVVFISLEEEPKYENYQLQRFDFLLVMVGASIGKFAIVTSDILPALQNQNMWNFRTKGQLPQHYLNFALRNIIKDNLASASGSAREFFQKSQFYEFLIPVPSESLLVKFNEMADSHYSKIELNLIQIRTLTRLRDTLLPKLMSGEVRVANFAA